MNTYKLIISFTILSLALISCQPEVDKFVPNEYIAAGDYNDVLQGLQNLEIQKTISIDNGGVIELDKSLVYFSSNSFINQNNEVVQGQIQINIVEVNQNNDMVKYDIPSINDDEILLEAETVLSIRAFQGDDQLRINPNSQGIVVYVFDDQPEAVNLYAPGQNQFEGGWVEQMTQIESGDLEVNLEGYENDTTGYRFILEDLGWISLQKEVLVSDYTTLCLELLESNTPQNTRAYILYDNVNTCQRLAISSMTDCATTAVPLEFEGTIVILAHKGGQQSEAASRRIVVTANLEKIEIDPIRMSEEEILEFIERL